MGQVKSQTKAKEKIYQTPADAPLVDGVWGVDVDVALFDGEGDMISMWPRRCYPGLSGLRLHIHTVSQAITDTPCGVNRGPDSRATPT